MVSGDPLLSSHCHSRGSACRVCRPPALSEALVTSVPDNQGCGERDGAHRNVDRGTLGLVVLVVLELDTGTAYQLLGAVRSSTMYAVISAIGKRKILKMK